MTPLAIGLAAIAMSADAFVASLARGTLEPRPDWRRAIRTGAVFGLAEAATPIAGWILGTGLSRYIGAIDHWIAFGLLAAVGLRMILGAGATDNGRAPPATLRALALTALATSVDALAVGVSLAFAQVNILVIALATGLTTMALSASGHLAGHYAGRRCGRFAEALGGLILTGMGFAVLHQHLSG